VIFYQAGATFFVLGFSQMPRKWIFFGLYRTPHFCLWERSITDRCAALLSFPFYHNLSLTTPTSSLSTTFLLEVRLLVLFPSPPPPACKGIDSSADSSGSSRFFSSRYVLTQKAPDPPPSLTPPLSQVRSDGFLASPAMHSFLWSIDCSLFSPSIF